MSNKNLIESYYHAFNKKDWNLFFSLLDDQVAHDLNQGARQIGKDLFRKFMDHMNACYDEKILDLVVTENQTGDRLAAEFIIEGSYLKTDQGLPQAKGQKYRLPVGAFFEVKAQKILRVTNYYNLKDWIAQVS